MNYQDLHNIEGLQFIPVDEKKRPIPKGWQKERKRHDLTAPMVGLVCGELSGGVEAVDIDLKYDNTGKLFARYKRLIHEMDAALLSLLVVQKTPSGGYHFLYRCRVLEGNLKLAQRPTTKEEQADTFARELQSELKAGKPEEQAKATAEKRAQNDKRRVLIETRGEGGQVVCHPSKGYELVHGDLQSLSEITPEQREILHNIARQFNQVVEEFRPTAPEKKQQKGLSPFEDYNDRGDVVGLLENHGWKVVGRKGQKTVFLRPGQTSSASSGDYDHGRKWFGVFTTSSEFEPGKAYLPYAVFAVLETKSNYSEASRRLYEMGYGDRHEVQRDINAKVPTRVSKLDNDLSFVAGPQHYRDYLDRARSGGLPMGLSTGLPTLDKYFLFKPGNFVIINGFDNVGKTSVIVFLAMLSALLHGWVWVLYCAENVPGSTMRKLMEFYWNKQIKEMNDVEFSIALAFCEAHFIIIRADEELYNYRDLLEMTDKIDEQQQREGKRRVSSLLIDPYNALKIELPPNSKLSEHTYHYEVASELQHYTKKRMRCVYLNSHAVTGASRLRTTDRKPVPPEKADTEGGGKWANKADEFLTIHRDPQDEAEWMITDIHIRKVKEIETGGRQSPRADPVRIKMMRSGCSFCEHSGEFEVSPIQKWHAQNAPRQQVLPALSREGAAKKYLHPFDDPDAPPPF